MALQWKIMSAFQFQKHPKLNTWALKLNCGTVRPPHFLPLITESRARCVYVIWRWAMQAHFLAALKLIKFPSNAQVDSSTDSGTSPPVT